MYQQEAYEFITYKDLLEAINSLDKERYELVILLSDKASALSPHFLEKIYNAYDAGIQAMQLHTIINNRKGTVFSDRGIHRSAFLQVFSEPIWLST